MSQKLVVPIELLKELEDAAKKTFPIECCGFLFGKENDGEILVKKVVHAKNRLESTTRFDIDPREIYNAVSMADKEGLELVGFYHSHPEFAAYPSGYDIEAMKLWPKEVWLIISLQKYETKFRAFIYDKLEPKEVPVEAK
ncbi:MAG: M67 family metallopeptidase [Euryarchaeota archaeon]|nr:M67 family metallopeptidase [Euryarchaeota archaeon]